MVNVSEIDNEPNETWVDRVIALQDMIDPVWRVKGTQKIQSGVERMMSMGYWIGGVMGIY